MLKFQSQLNRNLDRADRMGHMLLLEKITHAKTRRGAWFKFKCCECGGELAGRIYADGHYDIGGEVLAMECPHDFN